MPIYNITKKNIIFPDSLQISDVSTGGEYPIDNYIDVGCYSYITIRPLFSLSTTTAYIRIEVFDSSSTPKLISITDAITIVNLGISEGVNYLGSSITFDNTQYGASKMKIQLGSTLSSGTISFSVGGIQK